MLTVISPEAIEKGTGRSWSDWLVFFEKIGAANLTHKEIAQKAFDEGGAPSWWCQMVTVAYEQEIGRRVPGQDCNGKFSVSVGKTLSGTMDKVLNDWQRFMAGRKEFSHVAISRGPEVSQTDKWRYWRCGLADGARLNVNIYEKEPGKATLSVQHEKLESVEQVEHWRSYWKSVLADFRENKL